MHNKKVRSLCGLSKDHQVPGLNRGQVVKEFAIQNGIDVTSLDTHTYNGRSRASKKRFSKSDISMPAPPPADTIKAEWKRLISSCKRCG